MYSIENAVEDLKLLTHSLRLNKFHMLGHSFGGIVAYEYAKDCLESGCNNCLSLILDSTPSNMKTSLEECTRLEEEIKCGLELDGMDSEEASRIVNDRLRKRSECRLEEVPASLTAAIESRGTIFGPDEVSDYVACPPPENALPPTLLIRGQYDFITEKCIDGWRDIFNVEGASYREEEMSNCAHYCHLEDAQSFGDLIKSHCFINDY
jgi:pimeloyl-ACP methyl ester carboxylesterase